MMLFVPSFQGLFHQASIGMGKGCEALCFPICFHFKMFVLFHLPQTPTLITAPVHLSKDLKSACLQISAGTYRHLKGPNPASRHCSQAACKTHALILTAEEDNICSALKMFTSQSQHEPRYLHIVELL